MKKFLFAIFVFCFFVPTVSAGCLSINQEDALITIAIANNQSPSLFTDIFDDFCDRSYAKNETDAMFDEFEENLNFSENMDDFKEKTEEYVDNQIGNYSRWVEDKLEIKEYLEEMVIILNASSSIEEFEQKLETNKQNVIDQVDEQMNDLDDKYASKEYVQDEIREWWDESTPNPQLAGWEYPVAAIAIVAILGFLFKDQISNKLPISRGPPQDRSAYKAHSFGIPGMEHYRKKGVKVYEEPESEAPADNSERKRKKPNTK